MTSKLVVNTIESDTGISSVSFGSSISLSSTSKFFFSGVGIDIGADTNINRPSAGVLGFNINGSQKVVITSNGRLGIGTNNPQQMIEVQDKSGGTLIGLSVGTQYGNASFGGYNNYPAIMNNASQPLIYCDTNNDRSIFFGDTVGFGTTCAFRVNGAERLRITSGGDVVIGHSAANAKLHIASGTSSAVGDATNPALQIGGTANYRFAIHTTNEQAIIANKNGDDGIAFHTKTANSGSFGEACRITSEGYVTKPYNPVFMAYRTSYYNTTTSATVLVFDNEKIDVGGNYNVSNGRFTAPVTGLYEFGYASIASNTQTVYRYDLRINGSIPYSGLRQELRIDQNDQAAYGTNGEFCLYINMTAGQYAEIYVSSDTNVTANGGAYGDTSYGYTYFRGRLIQ